MEFRHAVSGIDAVFKSDVFGRKIVSYSSSHEHLVPMIVSTLNCFDPDESFNTASSCEYHEGVGLVEFLNFTLV